ncbi:hypothetical protein K505DRAFT_73342 [Melanomma pulvis-pyrius CBS 109.77]|uniref:FHA domain-containing protein n=1 Tax=Melanomma pulvis-pyrius CBS 109.77 TaxID=1314802 RepID=A0A6A6X4X2_9PLEO|nr:hypothetical protein K505DRAFT_73342 [Melanomma pulvis-pyrius CBS 109.77]
MWFIEHENLSGGKREWIKPGSQRLYGRTTKSSDKDAQAAGKQVFLDNKTISRKHMMLKVLEVPPVDGTKLHLKSQLEVTDLSCRQGTTIDGEKMLKSTKDADGNIVPDSMVLTGIEHTIRLSGSYPSFKIKWQPTVLTYAAREGKESKARSTKLHALDIKTTTEFVYDKTTHVVAEKRNLTKVLQGLLSGAHIVTGDYLDAIINAATGPNDDPGAYLPSKLEEDFDTWWPKEKDYIPPIGNEPVGRIAHMLEPNPARSELFKGLSFIFFDENQYNSLHDVVSGGSGKALHFTLNYGHTTIDDYVEFVRNTAGEKRRTIPGNGRLPVITIRPLAFPQGAEEWATSFVTGVDRILKQRSIQQNEFLDAIITNDASSLRKPPTESVDVDSSLPTGTRDEYKSTPTSRSVTPSQRAETTPTPVEEPSKPNPRKRPLRRGLATSRFTGFDDYEPPTKTRKIEETQTPTPMGDIQESAQLPDSYTMSQPRSHPPTQTARRRSPSIEDSVEAADKIDELFPVAAAMRTRRAATRAASASVEPETQTAAKKPKNQAAEVLEKLQRAKKKAGPKEIDVGEHLRTRVKLEEERRKEDEENMRQQMEGVDISEIRGLVQIEEMEIRPRDDRPHQRIKATGEGWNDEWNGRKNYKRFRRRGVERGLQAQKVIVPLEEAPPKKGFGVGDAFFLEETQASSRSDERRKKKKKGHGQDSESEQKPGFTRRKKNTQSEVIIVPDSDSDDDNVLVEVLPSQRNKGAVDRVAETQLADSQTQTQRSTRKRGPAIVAAGQPATKRTRTMKRANSSDDEETGFRFRRRA